MVNEILQWLAIAYCAWAVYQLGQAVKNLIACMQEWENKK